MTRQETARELEFDAALEGAAPRRVAPPNEALAMLARRGFHATRVKPDLPFDPALEGPAAERLAEALGHYAFRLFLRGAILHGGPFAPDEATRYVTGARARELALRLVALGLAVEQDDGRFRLLRAPDSFGSTLEWYVARELEGRLGFEVAAGVKFHAPGVGGDLDVVAAAEGKLVYLELKSSPPKHLAQPEVAAFLERVAALRPDIALFVVDTALRLGDKVLPLVDEALRRRGRQPLPPRRVERELWAVTPHLYVANARPDLLGNIARAVTEGLRALAPEVL